MISTPQKYDAVVVGAGLGGIYQLHSLLKQGLSVKVLENASGPGGTWFWNRYPGAMSDTNSYLYRYSWDKEDLETYPWPENYLDAKDILAWVEHVVDRNDLRKHMQFETEVVSATWNDENYTWEVVSNRGQFVARYLVTAIGVLHEPNWPSIPGLTSFKGELYHTARWPDRHDFSNKRVGVIGNGSTGVQLITKIAGEVGSLLCFQRHPQYSVPAGRKAVTEEERKVINKNYEQIWDQVRNSFGGMGFEESKVPAMSVSEVERERIYEEAWNTGGGLRFLLSTFGDITTDETANRTACDFIKRKITSIVQDPEKARKLMPKDLYARRPLCDNGYYAQFNRVNVDIIDIAENPIAEITEKGIRQHNEMFHELDVIICATGFNAYDGSFRKINIVGRDGITLNQHWENGPTTNMGVASAGFPNLLMVLGPKSPLSNVPPCIEAHVEFISAAIARAEQHRKLADGSSSPKVAIESTKQSEDAWTTLCDEISRKSLFKSVNSFFFGTNVEGKARSVLVFLGGLGVSIQKLQDCVKNDFDSFHPF